MALPRHSLLQCTSSEIGPEADLISDKRADDTHADESHGRCYTRPGDPFFVLHLPRFQALAGDRSVRWRCQQIDKVFSGDH
jgi:hypothetical protein